MSQKTLNLCLERYNFVKFGETTKSSHTVLCINNAYSVNSDKYRLTPTAIASKHGDGYVFTLNYDFDRPLFTIVQKSYSLDGTSGNIVFEGIDPISKGGSKYLRKVTVSPVKLSDGSYLLEVTNDEYLRIGTTGAALGDEDLESLNEKIVAMGGIEKSVENVGGKQVLKLDASGSTGAKEIVYFDVDPSDPPSGIYEAIGEALANNKEPVIRNDGAVYFYSSTGTDKYVFVGGYDTDVVNYTTVTVSDDDSVVKETVDTIEGMVFPLYYHSNDGVFTVADKTGHALTKTEIVNAYRAGQIFMFSSYPASNTQAHWGYCCDINIDSDNTGYAMFFILAAFGGDSYRWEKYRINLSSGTEFVTLWGPNTSDSTGYSGSYASAADVTALQSQVSSLSDVSAYTVKGEATVAQLNAGPSGIQAGWAYQLTDSGTLTDGTLAVVAGDTVAWDGTKWFPLVKSDYYATKTYAQNVAHSIAPEYDGTTGAVAGRLYMHEGVLYKCKEDTSGDWDSSKFTATSLEDYIGSAVDGVSMATFESGYRLTNDKYIGPLTAGESYHSVLLNVVAGMKIVIVGIGLSGARLWATADKNNIIKRRADTNTTATKANPLVVTIEEGETLFAFNSSATYNVVAIQNLFDFSSNMSYATNANKVALKNDTKCALANGYRVTSGTSIGNFVSSDYYRAAVIDVYPGESYSISGSGTNNARLWATVDSAGKIIRRCDDGVDSRTSPVTVTIEAGEHRLVFNSQYINNPYWNDIGVFRTVSSFESEIAGRHGLRGEIEQVANAIGNGPAEKIVRMASVPVGSYTFSTKGRFNIRFKFRIGANPFTDGDSGTVFRIKCGSDSYYGLSATKLTQLTSTFTNENEETETSYWPTYNGGITYNGSQSASSQYSKNLGSFAFSIKYAGENGFASIENDGTKLTVTDGTDVQEFDFEDYETMAELYADLDALENFKLDYGELDGMVPSDLATFEELRLVSRFKSSVDGSATQVIYTDKAPIFIPYGKTDSYLQVEIFNDAEKLNCTVNGQLRQLDASTYASSNNVTIQFYSIHSIEFFDFEACLTSSRDAEVVSYGGVQNKVISSVNPNILIYEGHGIFDAPSYSSSQDSINTTPDRLQKVFDLFKSKGYQSVSVKDIFEWYDGNREIPKRCFTLIFDDWRFDNVMNLKKRSAFTRNGVKANLAVISQYSESDATITYNGNTITPQKAIDICKNADFTCVNHTRNHRRVTYFKPSDYIEQIKSDIYAGDELGINPNIFVYPFGVFDQYVEQCMEWLGVTGCIQSAVDRYIAKNIPKYCLPRVEIGLREPLTDVVKYIL